MEPAQAALRHRLVLGKFQVIKVETGVTGTRFILNLGNSITMKCDSPIASDVRIGDWLTLYTEVMANADAGPAPIQ